MRQAATVLEKLGATVQEVSVPLHLLGPALWTPIAIEGLTETVLRNQGFGISRDDYYPVDMMEHLLRRRGDADALPPNVKLFTLLGSYVEETLGHTYYGKAVNRVRTLRAAYDAALRDVDVLLMPTTPQKAQPLPDPAGGVGEWCRRATEMFANTCSFDVTHHPALSTAVRDVRGPARRSDARGPALRRSDPLPRGARLRARLIHAGAGAPGFFGTPPSR